MIDKKEYLGDGVYVRFDGYHVILTTENGVSVTNEIALEEQVLHHLDDYKERLLRWAREQRT